MGGEILEGRGGEGGEERYWMEGEGRGGEGRVWLCNLYCKLHSTVVRMVQ